MKPCLVSQVAEWTESVGFWGQQEAFDGVKRNAQSWRRERARKKLDKERKATLNERRPKEGESHEWSAGRTAADTPDADGQAGKEPIWFIGLKAVSRRRTMFSIRTYLGRGSVSVAHARALVWQTVFEGRSTRQQGPLSVGGPSPPGCCQLIHTYLRERAFIVLYKWQPFYRM